MSDLSIAISEEMRKLGVPDVRVAIMPRDAHMACDLEVSVLVAAMASVTLSEWHENPDRRQLIERKCSEMHRQLTSVPWLQDVRAERAVQEVEELP